MNKLKEKITIVAIGLLLAATITIGANVGGKFSVPNYFRSDGSHLIPIPDTLEIGSVTSRIAKGWFNALDATTAVIGGIESGDLLPSDADTYDLGSVDKEWQDLYLGDAGKIYLGLLQDASIYRNAADEMTLTATSGVTISDNLNITGNAYLNSTAQVTQVLYVDANRADSYTENGSITNPFKTIQAAITAASGDTLLNVAPGTYDGDIDLGTTVVSIKGSGINATHFTGNMTAGDRAHTLEEFRITSTGSLTITDNVFATNLHIQCSVTVSGTGFLEGNMLLISTSSGIPLTITSTGGAVLIRSSLIAGNTNAMNQTAGTVVMFHSYATNNSGASATIDSSGGVCGIIDTAVYNTGFGAAMNLDNDGGALSANSLDGIVCSGNISCGTATTYVEGLNFVGFGSLSGSALIYRPASRISYDNAVSGLTATLVKTAIDELEAEKEDTLTKGNLTATSPLSFDQTRQVIGGAAVVSIPVATSIADGYLSSANWSTFNSKSDLALGETDTTAYRGDRGKTAYDYSQVGHLPLAGGTMAGNIVMGSNLITGTGEIKMDNNTWLNATNQAGGGTINMFKVNTSDTIDVGATLNAGSFTFLADSGIVTALDMAVSDTPIAGTEESYVNKIDGNSIFGIRSQADSSGGIFGLGTQLSGGTITTTDATVTTLDYITLNDESAYTITATITAKQNNSDQRSSFIIAGLFYRNGGNATQQGATTVIQTIESDAATDCVFDVNGNNVRVRATGIVAETWDWECHFEIMIQD